MFDTYDPVCYLKVCNFGKRYNYMKKSTSVTILIYTAIILLMHFFLVLLVFAMPSMASADGVVPQSVYIFQAVYLVYTVVPYLSIIVTMVWLMKKHPEYPSMFIPAFVALLLPFLAVLVHIVVSIPLIDGLLLWKLLPGIQIAVWFSLFYYRKRKWKQTH